MIRALKVFIRNYIYIFFLSSLCVFMLIQHSNKPWKQNMLKILFSDNYYAEKMTSLNDHRRNNDVIRENHDKGRSVIKSDQKKSEINYKSYEQIEDGQKEGLKNNGAVKDENVFEFDMKARQKNFQALATEYAENKTLILAVTDLGYVEMALNLYLSSFKKFNIENYLFVCSHDLAEEYLTTRGIHAVSLWNDTLSTRESLYSQKGYRNKTNFKTDSVALGLRLGLNVFLVDVDLVFLKNPMPYISQFTSSHDIVIQGGLKTLNSGCYLATNRGPAEELHSRMIERRDEPRKGGGGNQIDMNHVMKKMAGRIKVKVLDRDLFPWGGYYFYMGNRQFAGDNATTDAYVVHNNVFYATDFGSGAKRYKFREMLMWHVDDGRYYSDPTRKYLTFDLPTNITNKKQKEALLSALELAHALNRILILPAFNCAGAVTKRCNYQRRFPRTPFHLDVIEGKYREHVFLQHPLVPESVKLSQSDKISVKPLIDDWAKKRFTDDDVTKITDYLEDYEIYSVLNLGDLHLISIKTPSSVREMLDEM